MSAASVSDSSQVPDGWNVVRLGEVANIVMGQSPPGATVVDLRHEDEVGDGLPFIQGNAEFGARFPVPKKRCTRPLRTADRGDLLISVRAPVGHTSRVDTPLAIGRGLAAVRFVGADSSFGWHIVNRAREGLARVSQGSTFDAIGSTELHALAFRLPPLSEQRAIAAVLDSIDEAIRRADEAIAATERLRDALLHELLTQGLPGLHSEYKEVPGLGTIPASWRAVRLGDVAEVIGGSTPSRMQPKFWGGDIPWVVPSEVTELIGRELRSSRESITEEGLRVAGLRVLPARSVLLTSRATIGATAIAALPVTTNQGFQSLVGKKGIDSLWLYYCISSRSRELRRRGAGSTFREVSRDAVRNLPVLLPSLSEQRAIAAVLDSVDAAIGRRRDENTALSSLQTSTADALLAGRVRTIAC